MVCGPSVIILCGTLLRDKNRCNFSSIPELCGDKITTSSNLTLVELIHKLLQVGLDHMTRELDHMTRGLDHMTRGLDHMTRGLDHMTGGLDHMTRESDTDSKTALAGLYLCYSVYYNQPLEDKVRVSIYLSFNGQD